MNADWMTVVSPSTTPSSHRWHPAAPGAPGFTISPHRRGVADWQLCQVNHSDVIQRDHLYSHPFYRPLVVSVANTPGECSNTLKSSPHFFNDRLILHERGDKGRAKRKYFSMAALRSIPGMSSLAMSCHHLPHTLSPLVHRQLF